MTIAMTCDHGTTVRDGTGQPQRRYLHPVGCLIVSDGGMSLDDTHPWMHVDVVALADFHDFLPCRMMIVRHRES